MYFIYYIIISVSYYFYSWFHLIEKSFGKRVAGISLWLADIYTESLSILWPSKINICAVHLKGSGLLIHKVNISLISYGQIYFFNRFFQNFFSNCSLPSMAVIKSRKIITESRNWRMYRECSRNASQLCNNGSCCPHVTAVLDSVQWMRQNCKRKDYFIGDIFWIGESNNVTT